MTERKEFKKLPGLLGSIKIEPGTSVLQPGRLPSFRGARDLTLGALGAGKSGESKSRKMYTPNVNVQRNKNKDLLKVKEQNNRGRDAKRGRGRGDWKPGRGRAAANLIQSTGGIFSEGIALTDRRREGRGGAYSGDRDSASNFIPKPKLNLQHEHKFDRDEEEQKLKALLRDDFVDDPGLDPDSSHLPVELPLLKIETSVKKEVKKEVKSAKEEVIVGGVKIKQEKEEEDEMLPGQNVKIKVEKEEKIDKEEEEQVNEVTVANLLRNKHPQLLFLQLPDCMPGLRADAERAERAASQPSTTTKPPAATASTAEPTKNCTLSSLSEGCIGKLQILRSGKARLVLGNTELHITMGTQVGFRQDLISVQLDSSSYSGDMINLGAVQTRLSCSPDWESMLNKTRSTKLS